MLSTAAKLAPRRRTRLDGVVVVTPSVGRPFRAPTMVRNYPILTEFGTVDRPAPAPTARHIGGTPHRGPPMRNAEFSDDAADGSCLQLRSGSSPPGVAARIARTRSSPHVAKASTSRCKAPPKPKAWQMGSSPCPGDNVGFQTAYPIKLFEYMAAAILWSHPTSRLPRDRDGAGCGSLRGPCRPHAIAKAITWLLDNLDDAAAMGRRRQAVENTYNWEVDNVASSRSTRRSETGRCTGAAGTERRGAELHQPAAR
ncbi:MAG: hypothetical protein R2755_27970 [Acidimicrobiales bacterium]